MTQEAVDYRPMWESLGLDLEAHDMLLAAIPQLYQQAYLTQKNRPEGMAYFDFVMSEIHGLRIKELLDHKAAGGTVIGTFCLYVPEEIIRALGGVAVGLCAGAEWAYDEVERLLPANTCALIKSFMGFKLGKVCPYVESADLIIGETTCDGKKKAYELFARVRARPRHGAAADEAAAGPGPVAGRDRPPGREAAGGHRAGAHGREPGRSHRGGQRQAPRAPAPERHPEGLAGADLRQGRPAGDPGGLLRRRAPLHRRW